MKKEIKQITTTNKQKQNEEKDGNSKLPLQTYFIKNGKT